MLSSSPEKLRAMKEKMKKVLGSMRKKSTHSGVIDEDIRSTYSAVSMDEPSITSAATSMRTSRSKIGSAFVPVTKIHCRRILASAVRKLSLLRAVSYTHLTLPTTPYV